MSGEHRVGDPLLIELAWPDDAPDHLGFAQPVVAEGRYVEGWIMLHPGVARAPAGVVRRLVLHELGHLYGLADVDDPDELMDPDLTTDDFGLGDLISGCTPPMRVDAEPAGSSGPGWRAESRRSGLALLPFPDPSRQLLGCDLLRPAGEVPAVAERVPHPAVAVAPELIGGG